MAVKIIISATSPDVINRFEPFITYSSPTSFAIVWVPAASLPALDSVSPKEPIFSPRARGIRYFCFCSSEPAT
ncbi:hypothetical protein ES703_95030 [subsurface metagenome]